MNMCPNASRSSLRLCSARRRREWGQFPLQPLSLSPQILQHPTCPTSTLKSSRGSLSQTPLWHPCPAVPPLGQQAGLAACAHTPFPRWVLMLM